MMWLPFPKLTIIHASFSSSLIPIWSLVSHLTLPCLSASPSILTHGPKKGLDPRYLHVPSIQSCRLSRGIQGVQYILCLFVKFTLLGLQPLIVNCSQGHTHEDNQFSSGHVRGLWCSLKLWPTHDFWFELQMQLVRGLTKRKWKYLQRIQK